jgi:hypothetical protein
VADSADPILAYDHPSITSSSLSGYTVTEQQHGLRFDDLGFPEACYHSGLIYDRIGGADATSEVGLEFRNRKSCGNEIEC